MEKSKTRLPFLDIMMNKSGTKRTFTSNHPQHSLTNIPFTLAREICTIVENENVKEKCFKELQKKKNITRTKIP